MEDNDWHSISSSSSRQHTFERPGSDIKITGYLKKLKTMKKKYFVLRSTSSSGPARLEYYDSEKKFKAGQLAKRSIHLHTCFNINKKSDSRHGKFGISLYTSEDCFTVLTESQREQEAWLAVLLEFQNEYLPDGDMHREHYDHVWQVSLQPRGLGQNKGYKGQYRLCLNKTTVSLFKVSSSQPQFTIQLVTIRSVAHHETTFRLEVGNYAPTGAGEFWFTAEETNIAKDMHETLLEYMSAVIKDPNLRRDQQASVQMRPRRDVPSQLFNCHPSSSLTAHSPGSPNYPSEFLTSQRLRSNSGASRSSRISTHDDISPGFITEFSKEHNSERHLSFVPPDLTPPASPSCLDEQLSAYLCMEQKERTSLTSTSSQSSTYMSMAADGQTSVASRGDVSPSLSESSTNSYMSMSSQSSNPIPIHAHSFSEPLHSQHLPTVKEGGSNEGCLPSEVSSSPGLSSSVPRPEPAVCLLSKDSSDLPPHTHSLGSKPTTKLSNYVEMGCGQADSNDMSRAVSAPHILKGRKDRDRRTASPTPSASPMSISYKSDDSDSFMDYMPMRPRTSSDSFNYRNRTSSFGQTQQHTRPRSSSHGQGTRPVISFNKLHTHKSRTSHELLPNTSQESSLQGSFDSLRVSSESLRRSGQETRPQCGSAFSDYAEMRSTPSPQMRPHAEGYMNMALGSQADRKSPQRMRTDSNSSGRSDLHTKSSERLPQHQPDYAAMAPPHAYSASQAGDSYFMMGYSSDSKTLGQTPPDQRNQFLNLNRLDIKPEGRSASSENVDTYILFEAHGDNKPRTGSLGSKDTAAKRPASTRKSSSTSGSSGLSQTSQPSVSSNSRAGGSSDSIKNTSRQASAEKYDSLGKDFRKKSGSMGSKPSSNRMSFSVSIDPEQRNIVPGSRAMKLSPNRLLEGPLLDDEYVEFTPTATIEGARDYPHSSHASHSIPLTSLGGGRQVHAGSGTSSSRPAAATSAEPEAYTMFSPAVLSPPEVNTKVSPAVSSKAETHTKFNATASSAAEDYTKYSPAVSSIKSVHFQQPLLHQHHQKVLPSSTQVKQVTAKDTPEYVGFEPKTKPTVPDTFSHPFSHPSLRLKAEEVKETTEYVAFQPFHAGMSAAAAAAAAAVPGQGPQNDYIQYKPEKCKSPQPPVTPNSVTSCILDQSCHQMGLSPPTGPSVPLLPESSQQASNDSRTSFSKTIGGDTQNKKTLTATDVLAADATGATSRQMESNIPKSKAKTQTANEYMEYSPAVSISRQTLQQSAAIPEIKGNDTIQQSVAKSQAAQLPVTPEVSSPAVLKNLQEGVSSKEKSKSKKQKKNLQPTMAQNFQRQMSAPAAQASLIKPLSVAVDLQSPQFTSLQPLSPGNIKMGLKFGDSSSVFEESSPSSTSSRQKHWSGSSGSSQKQRKSSSDSERSLSKSNKSDSSIGGRSKHRHLAGDQPAQFYLDNSISEITHDSLSLEAKIIPAEARIRHSLGEVGSAVDHGLVRPDSTPCIQNLLPPVGQECRSAGDTPRTGSAQFTIGHRNHHSLSDLGSYQHMSFGPGSASAASPCSVKPSGSSGENNSQLELKPLNYLKLDLSCPDGQGESDGRHCRLKSRNSSDADEKQPPLAYAEIDFVKSQGWSKSISVGGSGDSLSSQS